ncbi:MAG: LysM peptidoglycan-binding domain-containing protein [Phycisphaerae bacterium]|nr:LysM peptidoglycan-binding domain-containing protein [Phycisphaerae bacterium]
MGTETRIGIVTGLVIVVVASVYFFYGRDAKEEGFLVSTGPKISVPPKIPTDSEYKAAPSTSRGHKRPATPSAQPRKALPNPKRFALTDRPERTGAAPAGVPRSPVRRAPRAANTGRDGPVSGDSRRPAGPHVGGNVPSDAAEQSPRRSVVTEPSSTRPPAGTGQQPDQPAGTPPTSLADRRASIPLRTGPSQHLVDATQSNLGRESGDPAGTNAVTATTGRPTASGGDRAADKATSPWPKKHEIAAGDTLSGIADLYYGDGSLYHLILQANPQVNDPHALKIGQVITLRAPPESAIANSSDAAAGRSESTRPGTSKTYRVRQGDTFYSIAHSQLGTGARWKEIYEPNRALVKNDPKRLRPGMLIRLP